MKLVNCTHCHDPIFRKVYKLGRCALCHRILRRYPKATIDDIKEFRVWLRQLKPSSTAGVIQIGDGEISPLQRKFGA